MRQLALAGLMAGLTAGLAVGAPALAEGELAGVWAVEIDAAGTVRTATWTVAETGEGGYTVAIEQEGTTSEGADVAMDGEALTFHRTIAGPEGPLEVSYKVSVEGDALSGEASAGQLGTFPITGARQ